LGSGRDDGDFAQTFISSSRPTPGGLAACGLADAAVFICCDGGGAIGRIGAIGATGVVTTVVEIGLTGGIALMDKSWPAIAAEQA
jgi:hypothetical protein